MASSLNGRLETNGEWQPREGYDNLSGALTQDGVGVFILEAGAAGAWYCYADTVITAAALTGGNLVTCTAAGHGLVSTPSAVSTANIRDVDGGTTDPNGNQTITRIDANTFSFPLTGVNATYTVDANSKIGTIKIGQNTVREVFGSCVFSDPNDTNNEYALVATTDKLLAYKLSAADVEASAITIVYPGGSALVAEADLIQAFDYVAIFRTGGITSWEWDGVVGAVTSGAFVIGVNYVIVTTGSTDFTAIGAANSNVGTIFVATGVGSGTGTARSGFSLVASGTKTQPAEISVTATITTDGKVAMPKTGHGLGYGDKITIIDKGGTELVEGDTYIIAVTDANNFYFYADIDDTGTGGTVTVRGVVSLGGGYVNQPGAEWGVYFQRRIWVPYNYDSAASPADRGVRDELIASDILDRTTYDPIGNQFRITAGVADFLVAVHPFNDDNLLAFNRNSIHVLKKISGSLGDVETLALTSEIGCAARKSIRQYGSSVIFLSDNGVYSISFLDEYNLRGDEVPLSEAITDTIARINKDHFSKAVSAIHDNRYYLAVPLDGSTYNNAVLVYNFLNPGWESIDTTAVSSFNILNFHVARSAQYNNLYAVTTSGGLYKLTSTGRVKDALVNSQGSETVTEFDVPSEALTRRFILGTMESKKWNRVEFHLKSDDGVASDGALDMLLENTSETVSLGTVVSQRGEVLPSGASGIIRTRLGNKRAYGAQFKFTPSVGRPSLRAVRVLAMEAQRQQQNLT